MKKLFVIFAAVAMVGAFAFTAVAADWSFYGNARMTTFWYDNSKEVTGTGYDDQDLTHTLQGNSRIGAKVDAGDIQGRFEYGSTPNLRLLNGTWNFGGGKLLIGQDYTPVSVFISSQAGDIGAGPDSGLLNMGAAYNSRKPQIKLMFGGFQVALITPSTGGTSGGTFTDTDTTIPKIAAKYHFKTDTFFVDVYGGYNSYDQVTATDQSYSVDSYVIGVDGGVNFGPVYIKGNIYTAQNTAAYGMVFGTVGAGATSAVWNGTNDFYDQSTLGYAAVVGFKVSDTLAFQTGYGALDQEVDTPIKTEDPAAAYYVQAVVTFAPGIFIVPEIGKLDYDDIKDSTGVTTDEGDMTYFGLKWQINF